MLTFCVAHNSLFGLITCSSQIDNSFGQIKPFTFNAAFGEETTQQEMFEQCGIKHLVEMAVEGFVSCPFQNFWKISVGICFQSDIMVES